MLLPSVALFDCFARDFASLSPDLNMPSLNLCGFLFRGDQMDGGSSATRVESSINGLVRSYSTEVACREFDVLSSSRREKQADNSSIQGEDFSCSCVAG